MKRSEFLKKFGVGIGVVLIAPKVLVKTEVDTSRYIIGVDPFMDDAPFNRRDLRKYPLTHKECYLPNPEEIIKLWHEPCMLIYHD